MNIQALERLLRTDVAGNIMALKFLGLLGHASEGGFLERGGSWATWFHYAPEQFWFDASLYPDHQRISYWNASDAGAARESADRLPPGIVKVSNQTCQTEAAERWAAVNRFVWFSADQALPVPAGVTRHHTVTDALVPLSKENGYDRATLDQQAVRGCVWYTAPEHDPQAICYLQPNYHPVWEISGVYVRPESRRRGLAAAVVSAAVNDLTARGLVPRYFVHDTNTASLGVAARLGLKERGATIHFEVK